MTLENIVLQKLAETTPSSERHHVLVVESPWTVTVTADRRDDLSCRVWQLEVQRNDGAVGNVATWADRIVAKVSGLMESLRVVEVDDVHGNALLRSAKPTQKADQLYYYELNLYGVNRATLRRYQGAAVGKPREQVAFALTNETIAKLADDLTAQN